MLRIHAPIIIVPTAEVREALGPRLEAAGCAAYREIAMAAKGLEIAHLQFVFGRLTLAVCSRIRHDACIPRESPPSRRHMPRAERQAEAPSRASTAPARP